MDEYKWWGKPGELPENLKTKTIATVAAGTDGSESLREDDKFYCPVPRPE